MTGGLFTKGTIGPLTLANRLVRSATWEGMAGKRGEATETLGDVYRSLAAGGTGLLITGFASVSTGGSPLPGVLEIGGEADPDRLKRLTDGVHAEGGKIILQIGHGGGQCRESLCGGRPVAPSEVAVAQYPERPRALTVGEIETLIAAFAAAATRARECGFDGIQLHAAHGYLINQFLSPHTNLRMDDYGGDLAGRSRFLLEILRAIRGRVGPSYPVLAKLNLSDNLPGGLSPEDGIAVAETLEAGGINAIEVSAGTPASGKEGPIRAVREGGEAYNNPLAKALRRRVSIPLILVGGLRSYALASNILSAGDADFISLARPLICQPDLPRLWSMGKSPVAACTSCNACFKSALKGRLACIRHT